MIYQRYIPEEELFSAQLELLMQNGQLPTVAAHLIGVGATMAMFWPFLDITAILLWGSGFLVLLLLRSLHMSRSLASHAYRYQPRWVYAWLMLGAAATGCIWSSVYIFAAHYVPITLQYTFLLLILMITAISVGFSVILREYFLVYLFTALWPIAWWSLVDYQAQPYNLVIGLALLAFCGVLVVICDRMHRSFRNMIALNWERENMSRELGELTHSLRDRNRQLREARQQLTSLANVDELTGLGNRRMANQSLKEEMNRARRVQGVLSLIMLDVDHFKKYNDAYGHPAGDAVLKRLADLMNRAATRAGELVARYGGEEFVLVLPGATAESALRTAERVRQLIETEAIEHPSAEPFGVITVSQGVLTVGADGMTHADELISRADKALYAAKAQGRNRVVVAP